MNEAGIVSVELPRHAFKALLQRGVGIAGGVGSTVRDFLHRTVGIDESYIDGELQTVFLDHQPVDDFDRAVIGPGAVLALSGAMPGLVGATMRRGGYYARMREGITHAGDDAAAGRQGDGVVTLKLFNKPLADLTDILARRTLVVAPGAIEELGAMNGGRIRVAVTIAGSGR